MYFERGSEEMNEMCGSLRVQVPVRHENVGDMRRPPALPYQP